MSAPSRNRPYLKPGHRDRPMDRATTATLAMTAVTGDQDQVSPVRPYTVDPQGRERRRAATRVRLQATSAGLALLGLLSEVQRLDRAEGAL